MDFLNLLLKNLMDWVPLLVTLAGCILLFSLSHYLFRVRFATLFAERRLIRQLTYLGIVALSLVSISLALPITDTLKSQLLTLLGILASATIALSSATFVGNAMAGLMLRVVKNFKSGDFLEVGEYWGRVSEVGLLHTEIQTQDQTLTTLPNLYLVTHPVTVALSSSTVISANVSLGYDVPCSKIEETLKKAALQAGLEDPFVQVTELGDFSVTYRFCGFLKDVKHMVSTHSDLRKMALNCLHEQQFEIVSPAFMNQRVWPTEKLFIPRKPRKHAATELELPPPDPEKVIFDKAEKSQSAEKIKQLIKDYEKELKEIKDEKDPATAEKKRQKIQKRIAILKNHYETLDETLDKAI